MIYAQNTSEEQAILIPVNREIADGLALLRIVSTLEKATYHDFGVMVEKEGGYYRVRFRLIPGAPFNEDFNADFNNSMTPIDGGEYRYDITREGKTISKGLMMVGKISRTAKAGGGKMEIRQAR